MTNLYTVERWWERLSGIYKKLPPKYSSAIFIVCFSALIILFGFPWREQLWGLLEWLWGIYKKLFPKDSSDIFIVCVSALIILFVFLCRERLWGIYRKPFPKDSSVIFILYVSALFALFSILLWHIVPVLWIAFPKYAALLTSTSTPQDAAAGYPSFIGFFGILTAIGALVGYAFSFIRVFSTERQTITSRQGHITDRINKAVENLGTNRADGEPNIEVRLGAIYALERIAQDSPRDHIPILEILSAYIRLNAPADTATEIKDGEEDTTEIPRPPIDIQTALTVIGRNPPPQNTLKVDLRHCNLQRMDMKGLKFSNTLFAESKLEKAYLGDAHLQGANLSDADLQGVYLKYANLQGANLWDADLQGANLEGAHLQAANLIGANLLRANLWGAKLQGANLWNANFQGANLLNANLQGANLREANLQGANLSDADLQRADLSDADLQWADLSDADLQGADLNGADLQGANLWNANFQGANLLNANLQRAYLGGAKLAKAKHLPQDQINGAFGDGATTLPDHLNRPAHWPDWALSYFERYDEWEKWQKNPTTYTPPPKPLK